MRSAPEPVVARRLNRERIVLLGWPRAILLQLAHPLVAAGVGGHSTFRGGAIAAGVRLHHTVRAMLSLTFGDDRHREATIAHIRRIHDRVHGTLDRRAGPYPAGTPYTAHDPALLLWVHATLLDSIGTIFQRLVAPLTSTELDAFCAESAPTLVALGGDGDAAPRTWRALGDYLDRMYLGGVLAVSDTARDLAHAVLTPRVAGLPVPGGSIPRLLTIGLLPEEIRRAYGFEWSDARRRRLERLLRVLKSVRRVTPDVLATWRGELV
jgi:uncharacterized protein (DUF2236 family)